MDRLASYYHWSDKEGLVQAINICQEHAIDLDEIQKWSAQENHLEKFQLFREALQKKLDEHPSM